MSRGSQIFWYLNNKNTPTVEELKTVYTHLDITSDLKKYRKEYRRMLKKVKLDDQQDLFEEN